MLTFGSSTVFIMLFPMDNRGGTARIHVYTVNELKLEKLRYTLFVCSVFVYVGWLVICFKNNI